VKPADLSYLYSLTNEYRSIRYDLQNMRALAVRYCNEEGCDYKIPIEAEKVS